MRSLITTGLACAALSLLTGHAEATPKPVQGRAAVLPLSEGPHLPEKQTAGCWVPGASDLKRLEAALPTRLAPYYRQYLGITERGRRLIYINGFSAGKAPNFRGKYDWRHHAVVADDGGDNFFQAAYDPATRQITRLSFNGPSVPTKYR